MWWLECLLRIKEVSNLKLGISEFDFVFLQYFPYNKHSHLSKQIASISFCCKAAIKHSYIYSLDCLWALRTAITVKAAETLLCLRMSYVDTSQQGKVEG